MRAKAACGAPLERCNAGCMRACARGGLEALVAACLGDGHGAGRPFVLRGAARGWRAAAVRDNATRLAAEAADASVCPKVCVLHHVSRVFLVPGEADGQPEGIAMGQPHELVERLSFAGRGPLDQAGLVELADFGPTGVVEVT